MTSPPSTPTPRPSSSPALWLALLTALFLAFLFRHRVHFDLPTFWFQLHHVSLAHLAAGTALIYAAMVLRAARWAAFVRSSRRTSTLELLPSQFMGFTAVALFGRLADLTRPFLVARRLDLPAASQVAVYTIERMFDLGAAALIFSSALTFTPRDMPHHELFLRTGAGSLAATLLLALAAVLLRVLGPALAAFAQATLGRISAPLGRAASTRILAFREGLRAITSLRDFALASAYSLLMWLMIGETYVQTAHSFTSTPQLAHLTFSQTMLLMAASIGSSVLQLPMIGWFTQIGITAAAIHQFFAAPVESATACAALLLIVTTLSVVPAGLLLSRLGHVSLRSAARASEEALDSDTPPAAARIDLSQ